MTEVPLEPSCHDEAIAGDILKWQNWYSDPWRFFQNQTMKISKILTLAISSLALVGMSFAQGTATAPKDDKKPAVKKTTSMKAKAKKATAEKVATAKVDDTKTATAKPSTKKGKTAKVDEPATAATAPTKKPSTRKPKSAKVEEPATVAPAPIKKPSTRNQKHLFLIILVVTLQKPLKTDASTLSLVVKRKLSVFLRSFPVVRKTILSCWEIQEWAKQPLFRELPGVLSSKTYPKT